ncbi:MAG: hypothetical protein OXH59_19100 [Rhodospirillaceae bacterium]|nr:hypothetical protein [Rhodospirillaceae bacterium]
MVEYRSFVQFPHPGREHTRNSGKAWNTICRSHMRKFMEMPAEWIDADGKAQAGNLHAWGEWEPESELISSLDPPEDGFPRYLWRPYWVPKDSYRGLHNTDPFIFGDCFAYSNCGQSAQSKQGLKDLGRGSVIAFGSGRMIGGKRKWVLDTVLVVSDSFQYDPRNPRLALEGKVSDTFLSVTGGPLADWAKNERRGPASGSCAPKSERLRLYRGATPDDPVCGMYSFFPAKPAGDGSSFQRPAISLDDDYFNPCNWQAPKGAGRNRSPDELRRI